MVFRKAGVHNSAGMRLLRAHIGAVCILLIGGCSFLLDFNPREERCSSDGPCPEEPSDAGEVDAGFFTDGGTQGSCMLDPAQACVFPPGECYAFSGCALSDECLYTPAVGRVCSQGRCRSDGACVSPTVEWDCGDGADNDGDGATDCGDSDCEGQACKSGDLCQLGTQCQPNGSCGGGTPKTCTPPPNGCLTSACSPTTGACVNTPTHVGLGCGGGICQADGGCEQLCSTDRWCKDTFSVSPDTTWRSISGTSASDVWAVGVITVGDKAVSAHFNGNGWSNVPFPDGGPSLLSGVWASTQGTFAVGNLDIVRTSASTWAPEPAFPTKALNAVCGWQVGAFGVWAVGNTGQILKYGSTAWTSFSSGTQENLTAIWAASPTSIWVGGGSTGGVMRHYDGFNWSEQTNFARIRGLWGSGNSDVWAVGASSVLRWNGTNWSAIPSVTDVYEAVSGTGPGDVWAVGGSGAIGHWNGTSWATFVSGTTATLYGVRALSPTDVWAVGSNDTLLHYVP